MRRSAGSKGFVHYWGSESVKVAALDARGRKLGCGACFTSNPRHAQAGAPTRSPSPMWISTAYVQDAAGGATGMIMQPAPLLLIFVASSTSC